MASPQEPSILPMPGQAMIPQVLTVTPLPQSRTQTSSDKHSFLTTFGNRIELNQHEYSLWIEYFIGMKDGSSPNLTNEEFDVVCEIAKMGFGELIDDKIDPYTYDPISKSHSIRLIRLLPDKGDGLVRMSMDMYDLNEDLEYECLSYTWGNPHSSLCRAFLGIDHEAEYDANILWPVICNGNLMKVRTNLLKALQQIPERRMNRSSKKNGSVMGSDNLSSQELQKQVDAILSMDAAREQSGEKDDGNMTRLMIAASMGFMETCRFCIEFVGLDPQEQDLNGLTAKDHALRHGHSELAEYLASQALDKTPIQRDLIWIDALCINQSDLNERSSQVQMMGRIYSEAERLVLWLGPSDHFSQYGLDAFYKLQKPVISGDFARSSIVPFASFDQTEAFKGIGISAFGRQDWLGLASLYRRQWFRRIWTLQEAILPTWGVAYVGETEIPWDWLLNVAHILRTLTIANGKGKHFSESFNPDGGFPVEQEADIIWSSKRRYFIDKVAEEDLRKLPEKPRDSSSESSERLYKSKLYDMVFATSTLECSDPRDRIYSLLGIAQLDDDFPVIPDYEKPTAKVWAELARNIIRHDNKISRKPLGLLRRIKDVSVNQVEGLPSWVPDLGFVGFSPISSSAFRADEGLEYITDDGNVWNQLKVNGVKVDTIRTVGRPRDIIVKPGTVTKFLLDPSWFKLALELETTYHTGQPRTEVLWRTLCADQFSNNPARANCGKSPAPPEYAGQFKELVCAMILASRDKRAAAEGRLPTITTGQVAFMKAIAQFAMEKDSADDEPDDESTSLITADKIVGFQLIVDVQKDPDSAEAVDFLMQLAKDELCFTPTVHDIVAYIEKPAYRLRRQAAAGQPHELDHPPLDRNENGFTEVFDFIYGGRRLYVTGNRYLGLGPATLEVGDEIWTIAGSPVLFVLRPQVRRQDRIYRLIGETYVHGLMRGEAVSKADAVPEIITIE